MAIINVCDSCGAIIEKDPIGICIGLEEEEPCINADLCKNCLRKFKRHLKIMNLVEK